MINNKHVCFFNSLCSFSSNILFQIKDYFLDSFVQSPKLCFKSSDASSNLSVQSWNALPRCVTEVILDWLRSHVTVLHLYNTMWMSNVYLYHISDYSQEQDSKFGDEVSYSAFLLVYKTSYLARTFFEKVHEKWHGTLLQNSHYVFIKSQTKTRQQWILFFLNYFSVRIYFYFCFQLS